MKNTIYIKNDEILLKSIDKRLERIENILVKLPEVQAATYLMMKEDYETARLQGKKIKDLWEIEATKKV